MKTSLSSLLSVAVLALAMPVMAQTEKTTSGKVVSSAPDKLVVQADDGTQMTFNIDAQSTVPSSLTAGSRVTVTYHDMGGGTLHAARVDTSGTGTSPTYNEPAPTSPTYNQPAPSTTYPSTSASQEPMEHATTRRGSTAHRMPATASPLPLVGMLGLMSLTAGLGVRALRRSA